MVFLRLVGIKCVKKQNDDYSIKVCSDYDYKSALNRSMIMINNYFLM